MITLVIKEDKKTIEEIENLKNNTPIPQKKEKIIVNKRRYTVVERTYIYREVDNKGENQSVCEIKLKVEEDKR